MTSATTLRLCLIGAMAACLASLAWAADYTQPTRDADFIRACRRQDGEMKSYFGKLAGKATFCHLGSFKATVRRDGLDRTMFLVPVRQIVFASAEDLRAAARTNPVPVGLLKISYGQQDPYFIPGTHLLLFDGSRLEIRTVDNLSVNSFRATLGDPPTESSIDPEIGKPGATDFSLASITPEGELQLYLQLADSKLKPMKADGSYVKVLLTTQIAGLVSDDGTPARELAVPAEPKPGEEGTGEGKEPPSGGSSGVKPPGHP